MSIELLGRIHKELSITSAAVYEGIIAISEQVNRKVQIIRLHWQASTLLQRMEEHTGQLGQQIVEQVSRRFLNKNEPDSPLNQLDQTLSQTSGQVNQLKQSLAQVDAQIRQLKLEAIHDDLLSLQRDLSLRSATFERIVITRGAPAVGQLLSTCPRPPSIHIATIMRGPFLLAPSQDLVFRPDDIVVLIGVQSDLDLVSTWFTGHRSLNVPVTKSA